MDAKTILVTGGNRSIGLGIVQRLAQRSESNNIIVACRKKDHAEKSISDLQTMGFNSSFHAMSLELKDDDSIHKAVAEVDRKFGKLDVLINNAGIALPEGEPSDYRAVWTEVFNVNVFSVRVISELFLPLLRKSDDPRIINISSARGSFERVTTGVNPPMTNCPYSTSKAALDMLTVDMANKNPDVMFQAVNPGHCKTAFNGFRGVKDPLDGGTAAAELAVAEKGKYKAGFWEDEGKGMQQIGW